MYSDVKTRNAYLQIYTGGPLGSGRRNSSSRGYSHCFAAEIKPMSYQIEGFAFLYEVIL